MLTFFILRKVSGSESFSEFGVLAVGVMYEGENEVICFEKPKLVIARSPALAGRRGNLMGLLRFARNGIFVAMPTVMCPEQ